MAEAIASVFGIITFVTQIGVRLFELREFYKQVKSAPSDIETLLSDCERLDRALDGLKLQCRQIASLGIPNTVYNECLDSCGTALRKLESVAAELRSGMSKSKFMGSLEAFLRKDEVCKQKEQLRTAKVDVLFASQILSKSVHI